MALTSFQSKATQLAIWNFQDTVAASSVAPNMTAANVTLSAGAFGYQNGNDDGGTRIGNSGTWNTGDFTTAGKYIQFSVTPDSGYEITLTNVTIRLGRTTAGPQQFTAQYSLDGFATAGTAAGSGAVTSTDAASLNAFSLSVPAGAQGGTITYRVWGHNAVTTGNLRFNNFRVFGSVALDDPPSEWPTVVTDEVTGITSDAATVGGEVTSDGGAAVTERGIAFNTSGEPTTADDTLEMGSGVGAFSDTLSGLTPGQTYFVRAYAINSEGTAYGAEESFVALCFGAPEGVYASATNFNSFTATWDPVAGATSYRLDVSLMPAFGEVGPPENILDEPARGTLPTGWDETDIVEESAAGGYLRFSTVSSVLETPVMDLSAYQQVSLTFDVAKFSTGTDGPLTVQVSTDGGATWTAQEFDSPVPTDANYVTSGPTVITALSDTVKIRWIRTGSPSQKRLRDIVLSGEPITSSYLSGYSNLTVSGTSQAVTGLDADETYYFRVRAVSAYCVSENSGTSSVSTLPAPFPLVSINSMVHDETAYALPGGMVATNFMFVLTNQWTAFAFDGSQATNRVFRLSDHWLANLSDGQDVQIQFGAWDPTTGLARTNAPPPGDEALFTRLTVDNWFTDNVDNFDYSRSSPDPVVSISAATNTWRFTSPVDGAVINDLIAAGSNPISATIMNNAGFARADQQFGWLRVYDDDAVPPQVGAKPLTIMAGETALPQAELDELVAAWNFNEADNRTGVSHGAGTYSSNLQNALGSFGGSGVNLVPGDIAGSDIAVTTAANIGRYIQFDISMTGLKDLVVSFAAQRSDTGYNSNTVAYSVNDGPFVNLNTFWSPATSYSLHTFDLSGYPEVNGASSLRFRITFGTNNVTGAGNNRFDNFQFNAMRTVHPITDAELALLDVGHPLDVSFNVYDTGSGIYRGSAFDGTNMHISITEIATNDTTHYQAALSSPGTMADTSTSLWRFVSTYSHADIGALFGDGSNYLAVSATVSDRDEDRPGDNLWISNRLFGVLHVIDDDTEPPVVADMHFAGAQGRPFMILTNGVASPAGEVIRGAQLRREGTGTNTLFKLSDYELANSGTVGLQFVFGAIDIDSGLSRGVTGTTNTVMSFSIGDIVQGQFANFNAGLSTASAGAGVRTTNMWTFPDGFFDDTLIDALIDAGPPPIYVTIPDSDDDRPNDQAVLYHRQVAVLQVIDDDIRGPIISSAEVEGTIDTSDILFTAFESSEGWPIEISGGTHDWTNVVAGRQWEGRGALRTISPPVLSGVRRIGLVTTTYADPWLQLPPLNDPGTVSLYAGRFGTEAQDVVMRLEYWDGIDWTGLGDRVVTNRNPSYELYSWSIDVEGEDVLLRVTRDNSAPQLYMEDLTVVPRARWISTNMLHMMWSEAIDDFNAVDEYRLVVPSLTAIAPTQTNDGIHVSAWVTNYVADITGSQGVLTGYVFAIDNDNDRANDRAIGNIFQLIVRVDTNPPLAIAGFDVVEDISLDDTSEVRLSWTPSGASEAEAAGWRQNDAQPLSAWQTYRIYFTTEERDPEVGDEYADVVTYPVLGPYTTDDVVLSNFIFGTEYRFAIAGVDEAGNIGDFSPTVTNEFAVFSVTQGVAVATSESRIFWDARPNKTYDLIYADANNFSDALNNSWQLAGRDATNALNDVVVPNGVAMRFYRASPEGRWSNSVRRMASEEVYLAMPISLHRPLNGRGQNWVAFPGIPDTSTVVRVFGTDLPAAPLAFTDGTVLTWFDRIGDSIATQQVYLAQGATNNVWLYRLPEVLDGQPANNTIVPMDQAVLVNIPQTSMLTNYSFLFVGRVPTNGMEQTIVGGGANNFVSARLPRYMHPGEMNLLESGFTGSVNPSHSDWIISYDRRSQQLGAYIYYNSSANPNWTGWRYVTRTYPGPAVTGTPFGPDDGLLIVTRGSTSNWTWTNSIPYDPPSRFLDP